MNGQRFTEKDWKLFRSKIGDWQEAYMDRLNREYIELLSGNASPSEKFRVLGKRIRADERRKGVQIEMRRSDFILDLMGLLNEGVISIKDLDDFSEEVKETVTFFLRNRDG